MKLQTKNFIFTSTIIILVITLSFLMLYVVMPDYYKQKKTDELTALSDNLSRNLEGKSLNKIFEALNKETAKSGTLLQMHDKDNKTIFPNTIGGKQKLVVAENSGEVLVSPDGSVVEESPNKEAAPSTSSSSKEQPIFYSIDVNNFLEKKVVIKDDKGDSYSIQIGKSLQPINEAAEVLLDIYPWILLASFLIGGVGAFFYSYYSSKRIRNISSVTRKMIGMDPVAICEVSGGDEVSELAKDINYLYRFLFQTIAKLNEELEAKSDIERSKAEFLRVASHELKTPVTAMLGVIEGMQLNIGDFKDHDHYLAVCKEILESQTQLIKDILSVSKIDMLEISEGREHISVKELLEENILPLFEIMAKTKNIHLELMLEDVKVIAGREDLKQVLTNLFSNAVNYTEHGGRIRVELNKEHLIIENQCKPLTEEELGKVFTAFYRPDYARSRKDGGTGLGLFIVAQLLERNYLSYDFRATASNNGMLFEILW